MPEVALLFKKVRNKKLNKTGVNMNKSFVSTIVEESSFAFAYYKIIKDDKNNPCDCEFIDVNQAFFDITGLSNQMIVGKTLLEIMPALKNFKSQGIKFYEELSIKGGIKTFEKYSKSLKKWFKVQIFSQRDGYFSTVFTDITSAKQKPEEKLFYYSKMQHILMDIASKYINIGLDEVEMSINKALSEIGNHFGADRVYIFDYDFKNQTTSNLFEWCNKGINPHINELQSVPLKVLESLDDWIDTHLKGKPVFVRDVSALPEGNLKKVLALQDIKTLITVPLKDNDNILGYLGFDWVKSYHEYTEIEIDLLYLFAQILVNIKLRIEAETSLVQERERLALALKGTNAGLWDWHIQTGEAVFDNRWAEIGGYLLSELEPVSINTWLNLCHPKDLKISKKALNEHFSGKTDFYEAELRMKHKNGGWVWILDRGRVVRWDKAGKPLRMTGTHVDISQRKKAEEMIRHLANHDALTGLSTIRLAKDRACVANEKAKRNNKKTAFMFIDLDGFKLVNDSFGHEAGDFVLKEAALRFSSCVRKSDTVSRIGGDEFLVIIDEIESLNPVEYIAKKIISKFSIPFIYNSNEIKIGSSIGISIYPDNGEEIKELIKKADEAMYSIKRSGKNNFAFAVKNQQRSK
ncbi:MAG: diguanylate cyclase [Desulforegulaceae bacterium]|nr:diguanylate cyclase [Desulforegulaceae bacterium]